MRTPKGPALPIAEEAEPVCACRGSFVRDGVEFIGTDPGGPEHGFEAFTRKRAEYETQEPREVTVWETAGSKHAY